ncbi:LptF/LptG family permease [Candidatus Babeliales bacterium]|nr:LptF/LptG family permease [Candidatus Babeliales bacterium]
MSISFVLSLLYNFLEFFEKLVRVQQATFWQVVYFTALNLVPTFARMWPVACWLATCLVVRELWQRGEWQTLQLLGAGRARVLALFLGTGLLLVACAVPLYEIGVLTAVERAETFRKETFKGGLSGRITASWFMLEEHLFCYIGFLDPSTPALRDALRAPQGERVGNAGFQEELATESESKTIPACPEEELAEFCLEGSRDEGSKNLATGKDLLLVYRNANGSLEKLITAPTFSLDYQNQQVTLCDGELFVADTNEQKKFVSEVIALPSLFLKLSMQQEQPSLFVLMQRFFVYRALLAYDAWRELLLALAERLLFYFQIALYPLLTAGLFMACQHYVYARWVVILLVYPVFAFLSLFILCLFQAFA